MEIQRYGADHLEVILDSGTSHGQKEEIEALDQIVGNWEEKCRTAETVSVSLLCDPELQSEILPLVEQKINSLDSLHNVTVTFNADPKHELEVLSIPKEELDVKRSHLKDLVMLAVVDGNFDEDEQSTILEIGKKMGFSERRVNSIYNESILNPDQIEAISPTDPEEKLQYLADLCRVILADGTIADWEKVLIFPMAVRMGFDAADVSGMLDKMIDEEKG